MKRKRSRRESSTTGCQLRGNYLPIHEQKIYCHSKDRSSRNADVYWTLKKHTHTQTSVIRISHVSFFSERILITDNATIKFKWYPSCHDLERSRTIELCVSRWNELHEFKAASLSLLNYWTTILPYKCYYSMKFYLNFLLHFLYAKSWGRSCRFATGFLGYKLFLYLFRIWNLFQTIASFS